MGRDKDCLLSKLVDYDQDSVKPKEWQEFLDEVYKIKFHDHSGIESYLRDI